jgi:1-aminocyclopropane-1-carboxylate deaminase/D-cysteine desulfhydrase-like pyridoxal-dependent ACC family enzyme
LNSTPADQFLSYQEPAIQALKHPAFDNAGISVAVLREDLNHPFVSGNKWWKLRDNLLEAKHQGKPVLTFGGAFSNHIYATAAACHELNIPCTGIIRGEAGTVESPTLKFAGSHGMQINFITREQYKKKDDPDFFKNFIICAGDYYIIPEGGTNEVAVRCCKEWGQKIAEQFRREFDCVLLPVGTGGTAAGIIAGISGDLFVHLFSALKGGVFLEDKINDLLNASFKSNIDSQKIFANRWKLHTGFHFGGYGKRNDLVLSLIRSMAPQVPLDAVYTAKMILGIINLAESGEFKRGSRLLAIHTGGLQGNAGFLI